MGMVSEEIDLVPEQRMESGLNSQMVFQEETLQFNCVAPQVPERRIGDPGRKTREGSGFVGEKMFSMEGERYFATQTSEFRRNMYENSSVRQDLREKPNWNNEGSTDGSEGDDDEDDDEDEDDDDVEERECDEVEGLIALNGGNKNDNSSSSVHSSSERLHNEKGSLRKHHNPSLGSSRGVLEKDVNGVHSANNNKGSLNDQQQQQQQQRRGNHYESAVTVAEPDLYYSQFLQGPEGSTHKEIREENGCGFSGGKEASLSVESGEPLRAILSDPITGTLMDDAMILPCGHSFGSGGLQHIMRMKACYTCSQSVTEDLVAPNLSLRYAIQAFRREEELHSCRASKRRRERFEQDKASCGDLSMYLSRGKGVQFPFAVTDRVIIKGNKRTPLRFVGREAVVTTQCLNGWYVVKTLDNAESVKLQYRSLAKVSDSPSANMISSKTTPNWL